MASPWRAREPGRASLCSSGTIAPGFAFIALFSSPRPLVTWWLSPRPPRYGWGHVLQQSRRELVFGFRQWLCLGAGDREEGETPLTPSSLLPPAAEGGS